MSDITFRRTGTVNKNGSVPGKLTINGKTWPTVERGGGYTFVRKGSYTLLMCMKTRGRKVQCLCFSDDPSISTHLIHDALNNNHHQLEGCIAPGLNSDENGIKDSAAAMLEVFAALGGYQEWTKKTITVENNIVGEETKEQWIQRRKKK
jgi:hypothetical protein